MRQKPERRAQILVHVPVNTWQAYNPWGGKSLYDINSEGGRANRVSFERPLRLDYFQTWEWEIQLVRFLEREGYDVAYQTDVDTHRDPASLERHRLVVVDGHDEYWTSATRTAFDAARDAGTNLAFIGANIGYWRISYEDGERTIAVDKAPTDLFRRLTPPAPECELLGVQYEDGQRASGDPPRDYRVGAAGAQPLQRHASLDRNGDDDDVVAVVPAGLDERPAAGDEDEAMRGLASSRCRAAAGPSASSAPRRRGRCGVRRCAR